MAATALHKKRPTARQRALYMRAYNPPTLNMKRQSEYRRSSANGDDPTS